jgi:hypothetical protein
MTSSSTSSPCRGGVGRATIQAVEIKRALEPLEEAAAKERLAEGQHKGAKLGGRGKKKTSEPNGLRGKRAPQARDKVAKATGMDARTLAKAEAMVGAKLATLPHGVRQDRSIEPSITQDQGRQGNRHPQEPRAVAAHSV